MVVLPWVPATTTGCRSRRKKAPSAAGKLVCGIPLRFPGRQIGSFDPEIDFGHREASRLKGKVEVDCCEVPKPLSKETVVPGGKLGQAIICNGVGGGLLGGEVLRPDHRDLLASQVLHGQHAPVTSQNAVVAIDQDRVVEPEALNTPGDLPNLPSPVYPRISGVRLQIVERKDRLTQHSADPLLALPVRKIEERGFRPIVLINNGWPVIT